MCPTLMKGTTRSRFQESIVRSETVSAADSCLPSINSGTAAGCSPSNAFLCRLVSKPTGIETESEEAIVIACFHLLCDYLHRAFAIDGCRDLAARHQENLNVVKEERRISDVLRRARKQKSYPAPNTGSLATAARSVSNS